MSYSLVGSSRRPHRLDHLPSHKRHPPMLGHNVFIWNVRGLNSRARRDVVRKFLAQERVSVVCLWKEKNKRTSDVVVGGRHRRSDAAPGSGGVDQGWILLPCSALPLLVVVKFSSSVISVTFESNSYVPCQLLAMTPRHRPCLPLFCVF